MNEERTTRHESLLFKRCLGLNDSKSNLAPGADPKTGETQIIGCSNVTVTYDGFIEKAPALSTVYTHSEPLTRVSAGSRLFFGDATNIYEYVGGATPVATRFPVLDGAMIHTPIDVRVSGSAKVYKSVNPTGAMTEAIVGSNPDPDDSVAYAKQPLFDGGFVLGARLFGHNGKCLQYSKGYHYDLWDMGNGFVGHQFEILNSGAIPGCICVAHAEGLSVYVGGDPKDLQTIKRFYPCGYIGKTLYSGFISKALGYGHVFTCSDGIYMVGQDGAISRLTGDNLEYADTLNTSYTGAVVAMGKYLAFGNASTVEYDFRVKAVMLRSGGIAGACMWNSEAPYLASGSTLATIGSSQNTAVASSVTLPYAYLGSDGRKSFSDLYFTGRLDGDMEIICRDQSDPEEPERWTLEVSDLGICQNKRIKLPRGMVGSKVSFQFNALAGSTFRMEEALVVFEAGNRR